MAQCSASLNQPPPPSYFIAQLLLPHSAVALPAHSPLSLSPLRLVQQDLTRSRNDRRHPSMDESAFSFQLGRRCRGEHVRGVLLSARSKDFEASMKRSALWPTWGLQRGRCRWAPTSGRLPRSRLATGLEGRRADLLLRARRTSPLFGGACSVFGTRSRRAGVLPSKVRKPTCRPLCVRLTGVRMAGRRLQVR